MKNYPTTFFDDLLKSANPVRAWFHTRRHEITYELVNKYYRGGQIADLGCGNCNWNSNNKYIVTGIDDDIETLTYAKSLGRISKIYVNDLESPALEDNSCSIVVLTETLEHILHPQRVIEQVYRILNVGGHLIMSVPYDTNLSLWKPLFTVQCLWQGYIKGDDLYKKRCGHINHYSPGRLSKVLGESDFVIKEQFDMRRFTIFTVAQKIY